MKNPNGPMEPATSRLVAQCLNQLCHCVPRKQHANLYIDPALWCQLQLDAGCVPDVSEEPTAFKVTRAQPTNFRAEDGGKVSLRNDSKRGHFHTMLAPSN